MKRWRIFLIFGIIGMFASTAIFVLAAPASEEDPIEIFTGETSTASSTPDENIAETSEGETSSATTSPAAISEETTTDLSEATSTEEHNLASLPDEIVSEDITATSTGFASASTTEETEAPDREEATEHVPQIAFGSLIPLQDRRVILKNARDILVEVLREGEGSKTAETGDMVSIEVIETLSDGGKITRTAFDDKEKTLEFSLGSGQVPQSWSQGIMGMKTEEIRRITIPHDLEDYEGLDIPASSSIILEITLIGID